MWIAYDYKKVRVVGVTFSNKDGTDRQKIISQLADSYGVNLCGADIRINSRTYKGEPAMAVYIDDMQVGFLSKELAAELAWQKEMHGYKVIVEDAWIVGGPDNDADPEDDGYNNYYGIVLEIEIGEHQKDEQYVPIRHSAVTPPVTTSIKPQTNTSRLPIREPWESKPKQKKNRLYGTLRIVIGLIYVLYGILQSYYGIVFPGPMFSLIGIGVIAWGVVDRKNKLKQDL